MNNEEKKKEVEALYRDALRKYFADRSVEGAMTKRYFFEGIAAAIKLLYNDIDTAEIYEEEYWRSQGKLEEFKKRKGEMKK